MGWWWVGREWIVRHGVLERLVEVVVFVMYFLMEIGTVHGVLVRRVESVVNVF